MTLSVSAHYRTFTSVIHPQYRLFIVERRANKDPPESNISTQLCVNPGSEYTTLLLTADKCSVVQMRDLAVDTN